MPRMPRPSLSAILASASATGEGNAVRVDDIRHILFQVGTDNTADLTYKFQGSLSDASPDFGAARSATNNWDYVEVVDLEDGTLIDGDTGITVAGVTDPVGSRMFTLNVDFMKWVNCEVTAWNAGGVTVGLLGAND